MFDSKVEAGFLYKLTFPPYFRKDFEVEKV